jgi:hypothetical protein
MPLRWAFLRSSLSGGGSESASEPDPGPPPGNSPPQITGTPSGAIVIGDLYSFTPNASDADGDILRFAIENMPAWATFNDLSGELSGQPTLGDVGLYENILISASDGQASDSLPRFSISVDQAGTFSTTLSWTAPTQNDDGSTLTDLAGYRIYWGTTSGSYPNSATITSSLATWRPVPMNSLRLHSTRPESRAYSRIQRPGHSSNSLGRASGAR